VGEYTAAAVAAIAFGERVAAVDTNVERVVARVHRLVSPRKGEVRALAAAMIGDAHPGDFTQAMMDLGATICRPRAPDCGRCPLRPDCAAFASGEAEAFPARKVKTVRPVRHGTAWWIERDGGLWLVRRPATGLLGGMAALPGDDWTAVEHSAAPPLASVSHVFTHFALRLEVVAAPTPVGDGWWHPLDQLADAGLPTLYRKAVERVLAARHPRAVA
jgi:A/G-specific adenine glycosylase